MIKIEKCFRSAMLQENPGRIERESLLYNIHASFAICSVDQSRKVKFIS